MAVASATRVHVPPALRPVQLVRVPRPKPSEARPQPPAPTPLDQQALLCDERMDAKSPELWPEQGMTACLCLIVSVRSPSYFSSSFSRSVAGVTRFLSSLAPLGSAPAVDNSCEWTSELSAEEIAMLHSFSSLSGHAILDQIREYHNLSFQLGLEEAHEMRRGNLLHIFGRRSGGGTSDGRH